MSNKSPKTHNILNIFLGIAIIALVIGIVAMIATNLANSDESQGSNIQDPDYDLITAKPVIYLYPEQEQQVSISMDYDGEIFASYPDYTNGGWQVTAHPAGKLTYQNQEYSYLFWEGTPSSERTYDFSTGFVVPGTETREFLQKKLSEIGLAPAEYNEFIVYWYPKMQDNPYNLIHFATPEEHDKYAKLTVAPAPDSVLRVFMVFKPLDVPIQIAPQNFPAFSRKGFTIVEWGGSEIN